MLVIKRLILLLFLFISYLNAESNKLELILKKNTLKVCVWTNYYGISYLDQRTQELIGIDSDLAKELAKDLKVNVSFVQSSFVTLVSDIVEDRCDIAMFAIGNTKLRRKQIRFTTAHLSSDIYAITKKTNTHVKTWNDIDKKGIVVAVARGTYHEQIMKERLHHAKLLVLNSHDEREKEVQSGRADVFMTDYPFGQRMLATKNGSNMHWAKLIIPDTPYHITDYGWAMAYGNDKFYNRIEKFVSDIKKDGRLLDLSIKNGLQSIVKFN